LGKLLPIIVAAPKQDTPAAPAKDPAPTPETPSKKKKPPA
jgi:hypothetical protein